MQYWLIKTEPGTYAWEDLVRDGKTSWDGVRNYQARNFLRAMKKGDLLFVYHSVKERTIKGIAKVTQVAYADPTAKDGDWSAVDIIPVKPVVREITLSDIKANQKLKDMILVKNSRLSVQPITSDEWKECLRMMSLK